MGYEDLTLGERGLLAALLISCARNVPEVQEALGEIIAKLNLEQIVGQLRADPEAFRERLHQEASARASAAGARRRPADAAAQMLLLATEPDVAAGVVRATLRHVNGGTTQLAGTLDLDLARRVPWLTERFGHLLAEAVAHLAGERGATGSVFKVEPHELN